MQLGFIGTGTMGNPMARCLLEAGHALTVYDVRREATANLCASGARWADHPRAVAERSDVVFTSLPGPTEVEQVVLDPTTGVLAGLRSGGAYIDMTTNAPRLVRRLAEACQARDVEVLDAPVSGRPPGMTIMVGGDATTFAKHRPLLACMGRNIFHNRVETETDLLVGKREDVLRRINGQWKIGQRKIVLDQNVLLAKNLTFFF